MLRFYEKNGGEHSNYLIFQTTEIQEKYSWK